MQETWHFAVYDRRTRNKISRLLRGRYKVRCCNVHEMNRAVEGRQEQQESEPPEVVGCGDNLFILVCLCNSLSAILCNVRRFSLSVFLHSTAALSCLCFLLPRCQLQLVGLQQIRIFSIPVLDYKGNVFMVCCHLHLIYLT